MNVTHTLRREIVWGGRSFPAGTGVDASDREPGSGGYFFVKTEQDGRGWFLSTTNDNLDPIEPDDDKTTVELAETTKMRERIERAATPNHNHSYDDYGRGLDTIAPCRTPETCLLTKRVADNQARKAYALNVDKLTFTALLNAYGVAKYNHGGALHAGATVRTVSDYMIEADVLRAELDRRMAAAVEAGGSEVRYSLEGAS